HSLGHRRRAKLGERPEYVLVAPAGHEAIRDRGQQKEPGLD
nr:hypothetical protein [Tanacetum cinerariifolium]